MSQSETQSAEPRAETADEHAPVFSNAIRLSLREWGVVLVVVATAWLLVPKIWERVEAFQFEPGYRMPKELSDDYWHFERVCRAAAEHSGTLLIGDSVIWGEYVTRPQTLSQHLNEQAQNAGGDVRANFANLGLDGCHPLALEGLIEHHGKSISGKNVIVLCNALWMGSPKHDLQIEDEFKFNHPKLVPQFSPRIPCYKDEISTRIGVIVERNSAFNGWAAHLQSAYFEKSDIPAWTLEHPYKNPLANITLNVPQPDDALSHEPISWVSAGIKKQNFEWVELDDSPAGPDISHARVNKGSLQWGAFKRLVAILKARRNNVLVVVGPFNEHMLTAPSLQRYQALKSGIEHWLRSENIAHIIPDPLPSELYADASHPLSEGYRLLAVQILQKTAAK